MSERECTAVGECRPSGYYWPRKNLECGCSSDGNRDRDRDRERHRHHRMREDEDLIAHYPWYHKEDPDA